MEKKIKMSNNVNMEFGPLSLLQLPDAAILEVMRNLDAKTMVSLEQTASYFHKKDPISRLPMTEHIARQALLQRCGTIEQASRFRHRNWKERLHIEQDTGCGFDREFGEEGGFKLQPGNDAGHPDNIRLTGMGPKLLLSDVSTKEQPVLHWRLRVKGNTAVEFGVIPVHMPSSHTALHKCLSVPNAPDQRCVGFCSQITAGSLLPLKAPVMRGTIVDILARLGHIEVVLMYPEDAKEIHWQNGQPIQRPYRGPAQLRFEQDFGEDYHVRLAVTSWAKASFDVMHVMADGSATWMSPPATEVAARAVAPAPAVAAAALQLHFLQQAAAQLPLLAAPLPVVSSLPRTIDASSKPEAENQQDGTSSASGSPSAEMQSLSRAVSAQLNATQGNGVAVIGNHVGSSLGSPSSHQGSASPSLGELWDGQV